jgi:hypothetical protein
LAGFDSIQSRRRHEDSASSKDGQSDFSLAEEKSFDEATDEIVEAMKESHEDTLEKIPLVSAEKVSVNFITYIVAIFVMTVLIIFGLAGYSKLSAESEKHVIVLKGDKVEMEKTLAAGDYAAAGAAVGKIKTDINSTKYFAESWGQDLQLWQMMSPNKSKLTMMETYLDLAHTMLLKVPIYETKLDDIQSGDFLNGNGNIADLNHSIATTNDLLQLAKNDLRDLRMSLKIRKVDNSAINSKLNELDDMLAKANLFVNRDLSWFVGTDATPKKFLVIFQNNNELRGGTGGSFGSFGIMKTADGKIENIDFGTNIFKLDNDYIQANAVTPPEELIALNNGRWSLKNAGFAVDGPEAFKKIEWFYNQETGDTVDGVITIDTSAIISLLKITGPIDMPEYGKIITADNFRNEIETEVQQDYFARTGGTTENEPKKIIGDMMPKFMTKVFADLKNKDTKSIVLNSFSESLSKKNVLMYFDDIDLQKMIDGNNYSGLVTKNSGDYLYINNSNIGGAKTDTTMVDTYNLNSTIDSLGHVTDKLQINRFHNGTNVFPSGSDQNFVRVLTPKNSELTSFAAVAGNFQVWHDRGLKDGLPYYMGEEAGKTKINFWMTTEPGATSEADMVYTPAYKVDTNDSFIYELSLQKQPGVESENVNLQINFPSDFAPENVLNYDKENHCVNLSLKLTEDKEILINFKKNKVGMGK